MRATRWGLTDTLASRVGMRAAGPCDCYFQIECAGALPKQFPELLARFSYASRFAGLPVYRNKLSCETDGPGIVLYE